MKNISKTIAAFSLSLLTIGAMAQNQATVRIIPNAPQHAIISAGHMGMHRVSGVTGYAFLDYPYSDSVQASFQSEPYSASPSIGAGYFIQSMNAHYVPADTGNPNSNNLLLTTMSVAFDTILDAVSGNNYPLNTGLTVDSLFIPIGQQNISGVNDTLVVSINTVDVNGIPTNTSLWSKTIVQDTGLSGVGKSWFFAYTLVLEPNQIIPGNGKFAVSVTYKSENKRDSMGFLYGYPTFACASPSGAFPDTGFIGARMDVGGSFPGVLHPNSFTTGYEYFESGHTGAPIMLPNTTYGDFIGYSCSSPSTFSAGPFQDIALFAEVSFTSLGVNTIASAGLSVGQNYPNPFNKETTISYSLTKSSDVTFTVYDMTGRILTNNNYGSVASGQHTINLSANSFSPGIYFYSFNVNGSVVTKKMVITE